MEQDEIKDGEMYSIRPQTPEEKERLNPDDSDVPSYRIKLNLDNNQKERLTREFFAEFEAIEAERDTENKLPSKWKERDAQYDGDMEANKVIPFNLHVHQSKIKVDAITRSIKEAFLDGEKVVDVTPRPDSGRKDGYEVAEKQSDYIDYSMDEEVKPHNAFDKIIKSSLKKFVGIGKLSWAYRREQRRREERYTGKNNYNIQGNRITVSNDGLEQFFNSYPEAKNPETPEFKKYKGYIRKLLDEKQIDIVVNYKDVIENNAKFEHIKIENFYVRNACNYNEGLRTEHCIGELQSYTYWELKKKEKNDEFENVDSLFAVNQDGKETFAEGFKTESQEVIEGTYYFKLKEDDEEEVKLKVWFGKEKKQFLGAILYPYYAFDCDYLGFWVELNEYGFYGDCRSVMYNIKDSNLAQNILLNLALYGLYVRNTITPIVQDGTEVANQIADNTLTAGRPIIVDELTDDVNKAIGFVQWPNFDLRSAMTLMELLRRDDSDTSKVSDLTSGRESSVDPSAPAAKTLALLQQSGLGVKEYIRVFLPSFNDFCTMLLQITYQMSQDDRKYKIRRKSEGITGADPFGSISRDEMIMKTTVQARAANFIFDKIAEKQEASAGYNVIMNDPYARQQPAVLFEALKTFLSVLGPHWKNLVDKMPQPEDFQKQQNMVAMQATMMALQQMAAQAKNTGVQPDLDLNKIAQQITQAQAIAYNPMLADPKAQGGK